MSRRPGKGQTSSTTTFTLDTTDPATFTTISSSSTSSTSVTTSATTTTTQTALITESATSENSFSADAARNVFIVVGVGIFLIVVGALVYFYRQVRGLDNDESTLKMDANTTLKELPASPPEIQDISRRPVPGYNDSGYGNSGYGQPVMMNNYVAPRNDNLYLIDANTTLKELPASPPEIQDISRRPVPGYNDSGYGNSGYGQPVMMNNYVAPRNDNLYLIADESGSLI